MLLSDTVVLSCFDRYAAALWATQVCTGFNLKANSIDPNKLTRISSIHNVILSAFLITLPSKKFIPCLLF